MLRGNCLLHIHHGVAWDTLFVKTVLVVSGNAHWLSRCNATLTCIFLLFTRFHVWLSREALVHQLLLLVHKVLKFDFVVRVLLGALTIFNYSNTTAIVMVVHRTKILVFWATLLRSVARISTCLWFTGALLLFWLLWNSRNRVGG